MGWASSTGCGAAGGMSLPERLEAIACGAGAPSAANSAGSTPGPKRPRFHILLDRLSLAALPWFELARNRDRAEVEYARPAVLKLEGNLASGLLRLLGISCRQLRPHYHMRMEGGCPLTHVETLALALARRIYERIPFTGFHGPALGKLDAYYFQAYFEKKIAQDHLIAEVAMLCSARWRMETQRGPLPSIFLLRASSPLDDELVAEALGMAIPLRRYGWAAALLRAAWRGALPWLFLAGRRARHHLCARANRRLLETLDPAVEKFATEYTWGPSQRGLSELFWVGSSRIARRGFLYFFIRPYLEVGRDVLRQLEAEGLRWLFLYRHKEMGNSRRYWLHLSGAQTRSVFSQWRALRHRAPLPLLLRFEFHHHLSMFLVQALTWKNFLSDTRSLAVTLTNECLPANLPFLAGAALADCISVGKQKSLHQNIVPETSHMCHDAYFVWGQLNDNVYLDNPYARIKTLVYTGPLFEYVTENVSGELQKSREQLGKLPYVIGFFDHKFREYYDRGEYWCGCWIDRSTVVRIYQRLIETVLSLPGLGLVIKSIHDLRQGLPEVLPLLEELERQGRCCVMHKMSPCTAATLCNMIVSGWDLATSGIEALPFTKNRRTVMMDFCGYRHRFFAGADVSNFVFEDFEEFLIKLRLHCGAGYSSNLGDLGRFLDRTLIFPDNEGYRRAGQYLDWIFEAKGSARERLSAANRHYRDAHRHLLVRDPGLL